MISTTCPHCEEPLEVPESLKGQVQDCPACGKTFMAPTALKKKSGVSGLQPGERVLWQGRPSHWHYAGGYAAALLIWILALVARLCCADRETALDLACVLAVAGVFCMAGSLMARANRFYCITNLCIAYRVGLLTTRTGSIPIAALREISVLQDPMDRLLNIGTVRFLNSASPAVEVVFRGVADPDHIEQLARRYT
jgi:hypothetical protein